MPSRPRPRVHARDHEHGGADPSLIHYEDVGEAGSGGQGFFTAEYFGTYAASGSTHELTFDDPDGFNTNDPASFELDSGSGRVRILQQGGYLLLGSLTVNLALEPSGAVVEILEVRGIPASGGNVYGLTSVVPIGAAMDKDLLPGSGGSLSVQYPNFMNLRDDYLYESRPVAWPLAIRFKMGWTVTADLNVTYSLAGMRFA